MDIPRKLSRFLSLVGGDILCKDILQLIGNVLLHNYQPKRLSDSMDLLSIVPYVKSLVIMDNDVIDGHIVSQLIYLRELKIGSVESISLTNLNRLTKLDLSDGEHSNIKDIKLLTNLRYLNISRNQSVSGISVLTNLESLIGYDNYSIKNEDISSLTKLKRLDLQINTFYLHELNLNQSVPMEPQITDEGIQNLINLTDLNVAYLDSITDRSLTKLINLKTLDIHGNKNVTNKIKVLTNLEKLSIGFTNINDDGISTLTNLTSSDLMANDQIEGKVLRVLTRVTELNIMGIDIKSEYIAQLPNLKILIIGGNSAGWDLKTPNDIQHYLSTCK